MDAEIPKNSHKSYVFDFDTAYAELLNRVDLGRFTKDSDDFRLRFEKLCKRRDREDLKSRKRAERLKCRELKNLEKIERARKREERNATRDSHLNIWGPDGLALKARDRVVDEFDDEFGGEFDDEEVVSNNDDGPVIDEGSWDGVYRVPMSLRVYSIKSLNSKNIYKMMNTDMGEKDVHDIPNDFRLDDEFFG